MVLGSPGSPPHICTLPPACRSPHPAPSPGMCSPTRPVTFNSTLIHLGRFKNHQRPVNQVRISAPGAESQLSHAHPCLCSLVLLINLDCGVRGFVAPKHWGRRAYHTP